MVAKHSGARHVAVALSFRKRWLTLTVTDGGAGFDPDAVKGRGGLGLIGMEERTRLVNGNAYHRFASGSGTRTTLKIPIAPAKVISLV